MKTTPPKSDEDISFQRPCLPLLDESQPLIFMQIDADYTLEGNIPVVRVFGITESENSVLLLVYNFEPYFYVRLPPNLPFDENTEKSLIELLGV